MTSTEPIEAKPQSGDFRACYTRIDTCCNDGCYTIGEADRNTCYSDGVADRSGFARRRDQGQNTLKKVSDQYAVPLDKLLAGLKLDTKTDPNTAIKELIAQGKFTEVTDAQKVLAALQAK